jgi:hypothetical protein
MRNYNIKNDIEIKFVCTMQVKGTDVFDAEAKVKETIRSVVNEQLEKNIALKSLKDNNIPFLINIKCSTKDIEENIVVHTDK